jgi:hypothetical protein
LIVIEGAVDDPGGRGDATRDVALEIDRATIVGSILRERGADHRYVAAFAPDRATLMTSVSRKHAIADCDRTTSIKDRKTSIKTDSTAIATCSFVTGQDAVRHRDASSIAINAAASTILAITIADSQSIEGCGHARAEEKHSA